MGFGRLKRGRLSPREQKEKLNAWQRFAAMAIEDPVKRAAYEKLITPLPPKRERVRRPVDGKPAFPLEREVLAEVLRALRADPRVAIVDRRQSGLFQDGNRFIRVGARGHLDISGMLHGGKYFEIECKRSETTKPEPHQQQRIDLIKRAGGVSGYCWSAQSALALLP